MAHAGSTEDLSVLAYQANGLGFGIDPLPPISGFKLAYTNVHSTPPNPYCRLIGDHLQAWPEPNIIFLLSNRPNIANPNPFLQAYELAHTRLINRLGSSTG